VFIIIIFFVEKITIFFFIFINFFFEKQNKLIIMRYVFGYNIIFHISAEITNKRAEKNRGTKKTYGNVLVIRNF
jgi:hypothetical protein